MWSYPCLHLLQRSRNKKLVHLPQPSSCRSVSPPSPFLALLPCWLSEQNGTAGTGRSLVVQPSGHKMAVAFLTFHTIIQFQYHRIRFNVYSIQYCLVTNFVQSQKINIFVVALYMGSLSERQASGLGSRRSIGRQIISTDSR